MPPIALANITEITAIAGGGELPVTAAAFLPTSVSGLQAWFRADGITGLNDGDSVTTWSDESGNGFDITQGTAGAKPTYKTNIVNGKPIVRFDGGDYLSRAATPDLAQPNTLFAVVRFTTDDTNSHVFLDGNTNRNALFFQTGAAGNPVSIFAGTAAVAGAGATVSTWYVVSAIFNGASSLTWLNGTADITTGNPGAANMTGIATGARPAGPDSFLIGDVAELIVYAGALSTADRDRIETYLGNKYGITVS